MQHILIQSKYVFEGIQIIENEYVRNKVVGMLELS